jgi:DNA-binding NtrC family response regulator
MRAGNAVRHVLVVEDDPGVCKAIENTLLAEGPYRVTPALVPDDAVVLMAQDRPDLAIIDAVLPKISGLELADHATALGIPVLIVTGDNAIERKLRQAGFPFLSKPFSIRTLLETTEALVNEAAQHRERMAILLARLLHNKEELGRAVETARHTLERVRGDQARRSQRAARALWQTVRLRVVARPIGAKVLYAPPVITAGADANYYLCGSCASLLIIAEAEHLHSLYVQCRSCGSCNAEKG